MRDKRYVDELTITELEHILAIRRREERQNNLKRLQRAGRVVADHPDPTLPDASRPFPLPTTPGKVAPYRQGESDSRRNPVPPITENCVVANGAPSFEDEVEYSVAPANKTDDDRFWRSFLNRSLLLLEVAAVVGFVFLSYQMLSSINTLQRETASAQAMADEQRKAGIPTLEPTPQLQINQVVLPDGHTPPTSPGGARFNYEEIPENLRWLAESQVMQPINFRPPPTDETALELNIPKLNVDQTIVQGVDWEALKLGIGQVQNGVTPANNTGNLVLAAHNDIYGEYFRYLDRLEAGDEFYVRTRTKVYTYRVTGWQIVQPNDVGVMESRGTPTATLISCYPYGKNDKRIVVFADRISESY